MPNAMPNAMSSTLSDIRAALRLRRVWMALASEDIGDQHRRTTLGPLWLVINYLAFAAIFVLFFDPGRGAASYPAYVATGLLVWLFISEVLTLAVSLFVREEAFIKGTALPLTIYVMRLTTQSVIRTFYALLGCTVVLVLSGIEIDPVVLWSAAGLLLVFLTAPAAIILFALLGVFFPDSQFVVGNVMRLGMFLTPVLWMHGGEGGVRAAFYYWNPFTYFVEIVREPIVNGTVPAQAFAVCCLISFSLWLLALFVFGRYRSRVVFAL